MRHRFENLLRPPGKSVPDPKPEFPSYSPKGKHGAHLSGGRPLEPEHLSHFERLLSVDFHQVRIHQDGPSARSIGALAFTAGRDIVFAEGQYAPDEPAGLRLLAHELAHVAQGSFNHEPPRAEFSNPGAPDEQQADRFARGEGRSQHPDAAPSGLIQRQAAPGALVLTEVVDPHILRNEQLVAELLRVQGWLKSHSANTPGYSKYVSRRDWLQAETAQRNAGSRAASSGSGHQSSTAGSAAVTPSGSAPDIWPKAVGATGPAGSRSVPAAERARGLQWLFDLENAMRGNASQSWGIESTANAKSGAESTASRETKDGHYVNAGDLIKEIFESFDVLPLATFGPEFRKLKDMSPEQLFEWFQQTREVIETLQESHEKTEPPKEHEFTDEVWLYNRERDKSKGVLIEKVNGPVRIWVPDADGYDWHVVHSCPTVDDLPDEYRRLLFGKNLSLPFKLRQ